MKTCTECGETKPLTAYYRDRGRYRANCKDCHKKKIYARRADDPEGHAAYMAKWRETHRDSLRERQADYYTRNKDKLNANRRAAWAEDPERFRARQREYWHATRERRLELKREYYERNREFVLAQNRKWREENVEKHAAWLKRYRLANRERKRQYNKEYYRNNTERFELHRRRRAMRLAGVESEDYTRREIYDRDGGRCRDCGKELPLEPGGFQIDHIVPISLGGPDTRANVQLMCPTCNRAKWASLEGQIHLPV